MSEPTDNATPVRHRCHGGGLLPSVLLIAAASTACDEGTGPGTGPLEIVPASVTIALDDTVRLSAQRGGAPAGHGVTWRSLDETVVVLDSLGLMTAVGPGNALVIAGLGDSTASAAVHVTVPFVSLFVGSDFACGRAAGGETFCWGANAWGQLGDGEGDGLPHPHPQRAPGLDILTTLVAGRIHVCGVTADGEARCWGSDFRGQLGNGGDSSSMVPKPVAGGHRFRTLAAGAHYTCGITVEGLAYCWGDNFEGQLGVDAAGSCGGAILCQEPAAVLGGMRFATLSAGYSHTCGVTESGALYCWGANVAGQLGQPDSVKESRVPISVSLTSVVALAAGPYRTCASRADGRTFCWGSNRDAALGVGDTTSYSQFTPVEVVGSLRFTALAAGRGRAVTCGLTDLGKAYCWGFGLDGQTGTGSTELVGSPTPVTGDLQFTTLGAGDGFVCGLTLDGAAYCWGTNLSGSLGRDDMTFSLVPVPVLEPKGTGDP